MSAAVLRGDEAELFRRHNTRLVRAVRRAIGGSDALVEDACATAWLQLMRTQPDRTPALFCWLRTVAIHEAYRLSGKESRDDALEELPEACSMVDGWEALLPAEPGLDEQVEARRALRVLAGLPERQRRYLALRVGGYRYDDIAEANGATYTNVNKHLTRARERVRVAEEAA